MVAGTEDASNVVELFRDESERLCLEDMNAQMQARMAEARAQRERYMQDTQAKVEALLAAMEEDAWANDEQREEFLAMVSNSPRTVSDAAYPARLAKLASPKLAVGIFWQGEQKDQKRYHAVSNPVRRVQVEERFVV